MNLVNLLLIMAAALGGGMVAKRLGYPSVLGELVAGILLGPPLLGWLPADESLAILGELGILLMMLYIGLHIDLGDLRRVSWAGILAAAGGFLVPAVLGYFLAIRFGATVVTAVFVALAMGVTALVTNSRILVDLKILDTRIAHVLMVGAVVSDLAALIVFAGIIGVVGPAGEPISTGMQLVGELAPVALRVVLFIVGAYIVGMRVLPALGRFIGQRVGSDSSTVFVLVVFVGLLFAEAAEIAGLHAILGAFVAGLFIDETILPRRTGRTVQSVLATVSVGFLAPIFFVMAGFQVTFGVFRTDLALLILVVVLATVGKVVGTTLFYLPSGNGWREGVTVGLGMNGRGAVEIIIAEIALSIGLISQEVFSILVIMAIATSASVPILLTLAVRWLERRGELVRPGQRQRIVIVGAGPVSRALAKAAAPRPVTLIDTNPDLIATAESEGFDVVYGSVFEEDTVARARLAEAGCLIAMTPNSRVNVLAAQTAANSYAVPSVLVLLGTTDVHGFDDLMQSSLAAPLFSRPVDLPSWDVALTNGSAREMTIDMDEPPFRINALAEAGSGGDRPSDPSGTVLPLVVVRGDQRIPFAIAGDLERGDRVFALARTAGPSTTETDDTDRFVANPGRDPST